MNDSFRTARYKLYFAPMEGITTKTFRRVFRSHFNSADRYFTPFLVANHTQHFKQRERKELEPFEDLLIPQILSSDKDDFIWAARYIYSLGYKEINLNLGCPYPTVFTKGKGSGMLRDPEALDRFLDSVFSERDMPAVSVKTRIGVKEPEEYEHLVSVFRKYPFSEIIVHPRVREEFYDGEPHTDILGKMLPELHCPVVYNGDIRSVSDAERIISAFPSISALMIGRGMLARPSLAREIRGGQCAGFNEIVEFLKDLADSYSDVLYSEKDVLFKMKELMHYLGMNIDGSERGKADVKHSKNLDEFFESVCRVLSL